MLRCQAFEDRAPPGDGIGDGIVPVPGTIENLQVTGLGPHPLNELRASSPSLGQDTKKKEWLPHFCDEAGSQPLGMIDISKFLSSRLPFQATVLSAFFSLSLSVSLSLSI